MSLQPIQPIEVNSTLKTPKEQIPKVTTAPETAPAKTHTITLSVTESEAKSEANWCDSKILTTIFAALLIIGIGVLFWAINTISKEKKEENQTYYIITYILGVLTMILLICFFFAIYFCKQSYNSNINWLALGIFVSYILTLIFYNITCFS